MEFSVLMTTYAGENLENLDMSLKSIYDAQTLKPAQIVLVLDGSVSPEQKKIILCHSERHPGIFTIVRLPHNVGQGLASNEGAKYCRHELIARMDSDDISCPERFAHQIEVFKSMPDVDVVGSYIKEIDSMRENVSLVRVVPETHAKIKTAFRYRNPVNNTSVMFRRQSLEESGGYTDERDGEDYRVFIKMLINGCRFYNIPEVLVLVRTGENMLKRRSKSNVFKSWVKNQKLLLVGKKTNVFYFLLSCIACFFFVKAPIKIKRIIYSTLLRRKERS